MVYPLVPCPSCDRHVRASESACPFCKNSLPEGMESRAVPAATQRLSRAAAFVFGATVAVTGCSSEVIETGGTGAGGGGSNSSDATSGAGGASADAGPDDDGGTMALYGDPIPSDAGPDDDGGQQAEYGAAPPPFDAGADDDGGGEPIYGAAPPPDAGSQPKP